VGHSLGGALANLSGFELATAHPDTSVKLVSFGCPRAVNRPLAKAMRSLSNLQIVRVVNDVDPITRLPPWYASPLVWRRPLSFGHLKQAWL
jgi:phospholipase A1